MTDTYNPQHPHEPSIPVIEDDEGRCLICGMLARLAAAEADADRLRLTVAGFQEQLVLLPEDLTPMTPEQLAQFNASRYRGRA